MGFAAVTEWTSLIELRPTFKPGCVLWDTWEVFKVEVYARVRRAVQVDGMSIRQASREFGWRGRRSGRCWRIRCRQGMSGRSR